jgi:hypothetical protein
MPVDLKQLFLSLQEQLATDLRANRAIIEHPGAKGDATEVDWIKMLSNHLPRRYQVSKAFVVDVDGNCSEQIDLVIYDQQYCPLLFNRNGQTFIPAESVYAVFEVKQVLDKAKIKYAGGKAASVRNLRRTSARITHAGGVYEPRPLFNIIAGILCSESSWNPPLGDAFKSAIESLAVEERLDLGCVLQDGSFNVGYEPTNESLIETSTNDTALIHFFLHLLQKLQAVGTVPAMDISIYTRWLGR